jgi:macrolide transport system ATP-binding/permease protein
MSWLRDLGEDLRYAVRQYIKEPGITLVLLITMALGIGANTGVFSILNGFQRPLPARSPEQLVVIAADTKGDETGLRFRFSYPVVQDFRKQAEQFSDVFAYTPRMSGLTTGEKTTQFLYSAVTGNYFSALGVKSAAGRLFLSGEGEREEDPLVIVLSYSYWQRRFGGARDVVGRQVQVDGRAATVVGIAAEGFHGVYEGLDMEGFMPLNVMLTEKWARGMFVNREARPLTVLGRLKPGVGFEEAQTAINVLMQRIEEANPATDKGTGARVLPETMARPLPLRSLISIIPFIRFCMLFLAALVLTLACMNVTNIFLVRATVREREMAIRAALGSGRGRLIRQMLTESVLLSLAGAAAGMLMGNWVSKAFADSIPGIVSDLPILLDVSFDWRVFIYALAAALVAGCLIGIVPALKASRADAGTALHDGSRTNSSGPQRQRIRGLLVAGQVAGSLVLLVSAGLFVRSLQGAQRLDLGFAPDHLLNARMNPEWIGYDMQRTKDFYDELERRVKAWPEVRSVTQAFSAPMGLIGGGDTVYIEGRPVDRAEQPPVVGYNTVTASYFQTMQMSVLEGRPFLDSDTETAPLVAVVNETMAHRYWPNQDPIGRRFRKGPSESPLIQVVGVAHDSKYLAVFEGSLPYFYLPFTQAYSSMRFLQIRSLVDPATLNTRVEREIHALDPTMPVSIQTMEGVLDGAQGFFLFRVGAIQAGSMGILGLLLAAVGVYGVMSYGATQRTREIGIRMALGARPRVILSIILRQGVWMVISGVAVGLLGAVAIARLLGTFLVFISMNDPLAFALIPVLLAGIALAACYIPAHRAMRLEPMAALRHE